MAATQDPLTGLPPRLPLYRFVAPHANLRCTRRALTGLPPRLPLPPPPLPPHLHETQAPGNLWEIRRGPGAYSGGWRAGPRTYIHTFIYTYIFVCVCVCACVSIYTHTRVFTHTHADRHKKMYVYTSRHEPAAAACHVHMPMTSVACAHLRLLSKRRRIHCPRRALNYLAPPPLHTYTYVTCVYIHIYPTSSPSRIYMYYIYMDI
jgi:hypothetical protein